MSKKVYFHSDFPLPFGHKNSIYIVTYSLFYVNVASAIFKLKYKEGADRKFYPLLQKICL